jgi:hypothetical protein
MGVSDEASACNRQAKRAARMLAYRHRRQVDAVPSSRAAGAGRGLGGGEVDRLLLESSGAALTWRFNCLLTFQPDRCRGLGGDSFGGATMESLVFACPQTRLAIDSGISTNPESLSAVQDLKVALQCPHCARRHRFAVKSGYWAPALSKFGRSEVGRPLRPN